MGFRKVTKLAFAAAVGLAAAQMRGANPAPTSVNLVTSANPAIFGRPLTLTATVSPASATGKVTFYDGVAILGTAALNNGTAALSTILLPAGKQPLQAYYAGDANYAPGRSPVFEQQINAIAEQGFVTPLTYANGSAEPASIVTGDFNGDGKADLAIANYAIGTMTVRLGNGDGTFQPGVDYPTGGSSGSQSIVAADFNGDGKLDIAVAETAPVNGFVIDGGQVRVFLGNGDGTFQAGVDYPAGQYTESVTVGDFNGDGIPDLATANRDDGTVSVFLGNGDGTFRQRVNYSAGVSPNCVIVADFNRDGKADLATVNWDSSANVFLGNGDGTFQPKISFLGTGGYFSLVPADFNNDGYPDLAISGYNGSIAVLLGNGDGSFRFRFAYSNFFSVDQSLAVCDCNADGKPDLVLADSSGQVKLLAGTGDGSFQVPAPFETAGFIFNSLAVADFNGDGIPDLALAFEGGLDVILGSAGGASSTVLTSSPNPASYLQVVTLTAVVSPSSATGVVSFFNGSTLLGTAPLANGEAQFTTDHLTAGQHRLTAAYGGDAKIGPSVSAAVLQVVNGTVTAVALSSSANSSYAGQSITLTASISPPDGTPAPSGTIAFYDGPVQLGTRSVYGGGASLVVTTLSGGMHSLSASYSGDSLYAGATSPVLTQSVTQGAITTVTISTSAVKATFGQPVTITASIAPAAASGKVTFYDGVTVLGTTMLSIGQVTLATNLLSAGSHAIRAYFGGSAAYAPSSSPATVISVNIRAVNRFQPSIAYPLGGGTAAGSIVSGDFNGDGKIDLAACTSNGVSIALGNGDGTFQAGLSSPLNTAPAYLVAGDFDGDGKLDVAVMAATGAVNVLIGNGDGTFQAHVSYASAGPNPRGLVMADFNGDGIADLGTNSGFVFLGNGDGTFQAPIQWLSGGFIAWGDFDGDGRVDLIDANGKVYLGNNDGTFRTGGTIPNIQQQPPVFPSSNSVTSYATLGDFNGDGKMDVAVIIHISNAGGHGVLPYYRDTLTVNLGKGDGTFSTPIPVADGPGGQYPGVVITGDFNGDGKLDLALLGSVTVFPGNGDGTFGAGTVYTLGTGVSTAVVLGAFGGDGMTDIAYASGSSFDVAAGALLPSSTTTLDASPNPSQFGQMVTLTAAINAPTGTGATGTVTFYDGATRLGSQAVINGKATFSTGSLRLGAHPLTAVYSGDTNFLTSTSQTVTLNVIPATAQIRLTSLPNPASLGQSVLITASVSDPLATGVITFKDGGTALGSRPLAAAQALLTTSILSAGSHSITVEYGGDANNEPAVSSPLMQTIVEAAATTVTLNSAVNPAAFGQSVTLTATVSPADAPGGVTFYDGMRVLGTRGLQAGQAMLTTNLLDSGTRNLWARYPGDANHTPAFSSALPQVVRPLTANGFGSAISLSVPQGYGPISVGDFNNDGKADLVICGANVINILLGNGDGSFQPPAIIHVSPSSTLTLGVTVALTDLNGDGNTDIIVGYAYRSTGSGVGVLLGKGDGTFEPLLYYGTTPLQPSVIATGDFNGDGKPDVAAFSWDGFKWTLSVFMGFGDGTLSAAVVSNPPFGAQNIVVGDFNGDGIADLAFTIPNMNLARALNFAAIMLGNGDGTFQDPVGYDVGTAPMNIAAGDFNRDGKTDLAIATNDAKVKLLLGNGDGTFHGPVAYAAGLPSTNAFDGIGIAVGDFNGDGNDDVAVSSYIGITVLLGNGDATFKDPWYSGYKSPAIAVADFDGDGRSDIAIGSLSVLSGAVLTAPSIAPVGVLNAAGLAGPSGDASKGQYLPGSQISPGSLARLYGNFLIGGTSDVETVQLGGMPAPVLGANAGQITFQVPWERAGQSQADLAVTVNEQTSAPLTIGLQPVAPGIFSFDGTGSGQGAIYDLSGKLVDASNPAIAGSTIVQIYCTGLGMVTNPPATGAVAPASPLSRTTSIPSVTFDYAYGASVLYSGLVPGLVGMYQVNALVPNGLRSSPSLIVRMAFGGITSNTVSIAIK